MWNKFFTALDFPTAICLPLLTIYSPITSSSALSYKTVVDPPLDSPQIAEWPKLYRDWIDHNGYNERDLTHFHLMPFTTFIKLVAAWLIKVRNPFFSLLVGIAEYLVLLLVALKFMKNLADSSAPDRLALGSVLLVSHPALFMFMRGNFTAGMQSLFLTIYILTALTKKSRFSGWVCLALAANIHPNVLALGTLEWITGTTVREKLASIVKILLIVVGVGLAIFAVDHAIDPNYTLDNFRDGYRLYVQRYSVNDFGLLWNSSLYGVTKTLRYYFDLTPLFSESCYQAVSGIGIACATAFAYLIWRRRLSPNESIFIAVCLYATFTPVFALYHMLDFAAPLTAVIVTKGQKPFFTGSDRLIFWVSLLCVSPQGGELLNGVANAALMLGSTIVIMYLALRKEPMMRLPRRFFGRHRQAQKLVPFLGHPLLRGEPKPVGQRPCRAPGQSP